MGKRETVELDEVRSGLIGRAIEESPSLVGLNGVVNGRRVVGVVVEEPDTDAPAPAKKSRGRK